MRFVTPGSLLYLLILLFVPAVISAQATQPSTNFLYEEGLRLYEKGYFEESTSSFADFIEQNEQHELLISANYYLARAKQEPTQLILSIITNNLF